MKISFFNSIYLSELIYSTYCVLLTIELVKGAILNKPLKTGKQTDLIPLKLLAGEIEFKFSKNPVKH